jgi:hypothetical protein
MTQGFESNERSQMMDVNSLLQIREKIALDLQIRYNN